jgi:hypothetical protein
LGNIEKSVQQQITIRKNRNRYNAGMERKERLQNGRGNAMLVSDSITMLAAIMSCSKMQG